MNFGHDLPGVQWIKGRPCESCGVRLAVFSERRLCGTCERADEPTIVTTVYRGDVLPGPASGRDRDDSRSGKCRVWYDPWTGETADVAEAFLAPWSVPYVGCLLDADHLGGHDWDMRVVPVRPVRSSRPFPPASKSLVRRRRTPTAYCAPSAVQLLLLSLDLTKKQAATALGVSETLIWMWTREVQVSEAGYRRYLLRAERWRSIKTKLTEYARSR